MLGVGAVGLLLAAGCAAAPNQTDVEPPASQVPAATGEPFATEDEPSELNPGGQVTVDRRDEKAFSQSAPRLDFSGEANFKSGNLLFRNTHSGLGPLLNAPTCQGCHLQDGKGSPPQDDSGSLVGLLVRLSVPDPPRPDRTEPDPIYGDQLQTVGVSGPIGEGELVIEYQSVRGNYPDGQPCELRRPVYKVRHLSFGDFTPGIMFSPRSR